jgi:hypothetical protein
VGDYRFEDEVFRRLHEVARAAQEVPANAQPRRLQDALVSLVALDVLSAGTLTVPTSSSGSDYTPSAGPSS